MAKQAQRRHKTKPTYLPESTNLPPALDIRRPSEDATDGGS
jgi:hypothetical protein